MNLPFFLPRRKSGRNFLASSAPLILVVVKKAGLFLVYIAANLGIAVAFCPSFPFTPLSSMYSPLPGFISSLPSSPAIDFLFPPYILFGKQLPPPKVWHFAQGSLFFFLLPFPRFHASKAKRGKKEKRGLLISPLKSLFFFVPRVSPDLHLSFHRAFAQL